MPLQIAPVALHPQGEVQDVRAAAARAVLSGPLTVDPLGRRFHVEWDPPAPVTPLGQWVFLAQFLAAGGLFADWVRQCPLRFTSPNAPALADLLGTLTLAVLAGQNRYARVTGLRADTVNPQGLGMRKVCSKDSVRRLAAWRAATNLARGLAVAVDSGSGRDGPTDLRPAGGGPSGLQPAQAGPAQPRLPPVVPAPPAPGAGRGSAPRQTTRRRAPPRQPLACVGRPARGMSSLAGVRRQRLRQRNADGDCEARGQKYLFRLRRSPGVKQLLTLMERQGGWQSGVHGCSGLEGQLQLSGWSGKRRVVVLRRPKERPPQVCADPRALPWPALALNAPPPEYPYQVLVTNLTEELLSLSSLYAQRADAENVYDELKNQWGWGAFTTKDLLRCPVAARKVALIYNWWNLFVRCAEPERPREAVTSRPLLLCAVGRVIESGRQITLRLTSTHAEAARAQRLLTGVSLFLSGLLNTAEQLTPATRWDRIWERILSPWLRPAGLLPGPSG